MKKWALLLGLCLACTWGWAGVSITDDKGR
jgi:hypothetical protein